MTAVFIAAVAAVVTTVSAPLIRVFLIRKNVLDVPNHRSSHSTPVPRAGGLACLAGVAAAASAAMAVDADLSWPTVTAAVALCVVGFVDDVKSLPATPRLALQVITGAALGAATGGAWHTLFAAVLFPVVVNVVNFMDGINGISGAVLLVWGVAAVVLGLSSGLMPLMVLGAMALGAALGFLPWNVPRARLFLGDSGSYLMGGLIAAGVTISTPAHVSPVVLLSPLALYVGDVALTLARRKVRGAPLTEAHREHAYQRLVSVTGLSHLSVASMVAALSGLVLAAWLSLSLAASAVVTGMIVAFFLALPTFTERKI